MSDEVLDRIVWRDYTIEIVPDYDATNPLLEYDGYPTLVLHRKAERRFGWTTDKEWGKRLNDALDQLAHRGATRRLHGPGGALDVIGRWLRVVHRMPVVLPITVFEHSGVAVHLGDGKHWDYLGDWDSRWIGWVFFTEEHAAQWGPSDPAEQLRNMEVTFAEFAAWVAQDVIGYRIITPDNIVLTEVFGVYGSDSFNEPDGWALIECRGVIADDIAQQ